METRGQGDATKKQKNGEIGKEFARTRRKEIADCGFRIAEWVEQRRGDTETRTALEFESMFDF